MTTKVQDVLTVPDRPVPRGLRYGAGVSRVLKDQLLITQQTRAFAAETMALANSLIGAIEFALTHLDRDETDLARRELQTHLDAAKHFFPDPDNRQ